MEDLTELKPIITLFFGDDKEEIYRVAESVYIGKDGNRLYSMNEDDVAEWLEELRCAFPSMDLPRYAEDLG